MEKQHTVWKKLFDCQKEFPQIPKNKDGYNYRYADLPELKKLTDPVLQKHGLMVVDVCRGDVLTTMVVDKETGDNISTEWKLLDTESPQTRGSEKTYGRRYNRLDLLGLSPDDDDGAAASQKPTYSRQGRRDDFKAKARPTPTLAPETLTGPDWVIPFGKKYKGKRIGDLSLSELKGYKAYLESSDRISNMGNRFIHEAAAILDGNAQDNVQEVFGDNPPTPTDEDIPF